MTTTPAKFSMAAYWTASIRRMTCGATLDQVTEEQVYQAVLDGIAEARRINGDGA